MPQRAGDAAQQLPVMRAYQVQANHVYLGWSLEKFSISLTDDRRPTMATIIMDGGVVSSALCSLIRRTLLRACVWQLALGAWRRGRRCYSARS
jgi:hypothetical protein